MHFSSRGSNEKEHPGVLWCHAGRNAYSGPQNAERLHLRTIDDYNGLATGPKAFCRRQEVLKPGVDEVEMPVATVGDGPTFVRDDSLEVWTDVARKIAEQIVGISDDRSSIRVQMGEPCRDDESCTIPEGVNVNVDHSFYGDVGVRIGKEGRSRC